MKVILVPTLRVGTRLTTLCVESASLDAERRTVRYDAERRNEGRGKMLWELRTISARFALGIATKDDLVDAAHRALDNGIYAHGLGEIITSRNPSWYDLPPHFESAMRELEIAIPDWDKSIDILAQSYMVPLSEELLRPRDAAERIYEDYNGVYSLPLQRGI